MNHLFIQIDRYDFNQIYLIGLSGSYEKTRKKKNIIISTAELELLGSYTSRSYNNIRNLYISSSIMMIMLLIYQFMNIMPESLTISIQISMMLFESFCLSSLVYLLRFRDRFFSKPLDPLTKVSNKMHIFAQMHTDTLTLYYNYTHYYILL